jgi:small neutral amino acid transporter SnatA (MarC family)
MMGGHEDLFIGSVSVGLGLILIAAAATNWPWYYTLRTSRFLESKLGRGGARMFHAVTGTLLIALGVAITCGLRG